MILNRIITYIGSCMIMTMALGCTSADDPDASVVPQERGLRFSAQQNGSRASFDGLKSAFEPGDRVGSVIEVTDGTGTVCKTVSWTVNAASDLVLDEPQAYLRHDAASGDEAALTVPGDYKLRFHFFYPYYTDQEMAGNLTTAIKTCGSGMTLDTFMDGFTGHFAKPPYNPNGWSKPDDMSWIAPGQVYNQCEYFKSGICRPVMSESRKMTISPDYGSGNISITDNEWGTVYQPNWERYGAFVHPSQRTRAHVRYSDFMWTAWNETITKDSRGVKKLKFAKKTAVIELTADAELTDVYYDSDNGIRRGYFVNVRTGQVTLMPDDTAGMEPVYKRVFTPYKYEGENRYRIHFPPQTGFEGRVHFTIDGKPLVIELGSKLKELKENHLYTLSVSRSGKCTLIINDWKDGQNIVLWDRLEK